MSCALFSGFRFKVHGRVQGVFFRKFTQKEALSLGLVGFVRNADDGTVEGDAQGSNEKIEQLYVMI